MRHDDDDIELAEGDMTEIRVMKRTRRKHLEAARNQQLPSGRNAPTGKPEIMFYGVSGLY